MPGERRVAAQYWCTNMCNATLFLSHQMVVFWEDPLLPGEVAKSALTCRVKCYGALHALTTSG